MLCSSGCVCCSLSGALLTIVGTIAQNTIPDHPKRRIAAVLESIGLVDPEPVLRLIESQLDLQTQSQIRTVVTVLDASTFVYNVHYKTHIYKSKY